MSFRSVIAIISTLVGAGVIVCYLTTRKNHRHPHKRARYKRNNPDRQGHLKKTRGKTKLEYQSVHEKQLPIHPTQPETESSVPKGSDAKASVHTTQEEAPAESSEVIDQWDVLHSEHRIEPENRGGKPKGYPAASRNTESERPELPSPYVQLICRKSGTQWDICIELRDRPTMNNTGVQVTQNGYPLDQVIDNCYLVQALKGELEVQYSNEEVVKYKMPKSNEGCFAFKLKGRKGDHVMKISRGEYLILAPEEWQRYENSNQEYIAPERVSIEGYKAHFFNVGRDNMGGNSIAFVTPDGNPVVLHEVKPEFDFQGSMVPGFMQEEASLFLEPPAIIPRDSNRGWASIFEIVLVEEGDSISRKRWRQALNPPMGASPLDLGEVMRDLDGGFFSCRLYDKNKQLLDSLSFKFIRQFNGVEIEEYSIAPGPDGHAPLTISFKHGPRVSVQPLSPESIEVIKEEFQTRCVIPAHHSADVTEWQLSSQSLVQVKVSLLIKRLWWAVVEEGEVPENWTDRLLIISRNDIKATSKKVFAFKLPYAGWISGFDIGFSEHSSLYVKTKVRSSQFITVPLRELGNFSEARTIRSTLPIKIWIENVTISNPFSVMLLPRLGLGCKWCQCTFEEKVDLIGHIRKEHLDDLNDEIKKLFQPLTYDELRDYSPELSLPKYIHQCSYCDYYIRSDDPKNPTSAICDHIETECPKAHSEEGRRKIKFRQVTDVDEIRRMVIKDLPEVDKCILCSDHLQDVTKEKRIDHLIEWHLEKFYQMREDVNVS